MNRYVKVDLLFSIGLIITLMQLVSCTPSAQTRTAQDGLFSTQTLDLTQTSPPPVIASPTPTKTEGYTIPDQPLGDEGPWLLIQDNDGVWAINSDGSGLTKIIDWANNNIRKDSVRFIPAAGHSTLAMLEFDSSLFSFPTLSIVSLPNGEVQYSLHLLSEAIEQSLQDAERYTEVIDIFAAVGPLNKPSWSPDGRLLAFNAAIDGDSADLYTYKPANDNLARLTSGSTQSLTPFWSPQGSVIVQGGVETIGWDSSGMGYQMDAIWAITIADASVKLLSVSDVNGYENVLGWTSNIAVLIDTLEAYCPYRNLRTINIESGKTKIHRSDGYDLRAFNRINGVILFAILDTDHSISECAPTDPPGFYLLDLAEDTIQLLEIDPAVAAEVLYNTAADRFFVHAGEQLHIIKTDGNVLHFPAPTRGYQPLLISKTGDQWAFIDKDSALWAGDDGGMLTRVYQGKIEARTWSPEGNALFFLAEEEEQLTLYIAPAPDFMPITINTGFDYARMGDNLIWVLP